MCLFNSLVGSFLNYLNLYKKRAVSSEVTSRNIDTDNNLNMGTTAPANSNHWVAYAGITFK
ncbi:MAG: hypothetical protein L3J34_08030 [Flavobacteriaceae bacterium]|nr:hypothetical protein [Flavobacteriaceae bacterium]